MNGDPVREALEHEFPEWERLEGETMGVPWVARCQGARVSVGPAPAAPPPPLHWIVLIADWAQVLLPVPFTYPSGSDELAATRRQIGQAVVRELAKRPLPATVDGERFSLVFVPPLLAAGAGGVLKLFIRGRELLGPEIDWETTARLEHDIQLADSADWHALRVAAHYWLTQHRAAWA